MHIIIFTICLKYFLHFVNYNWFVSIWFLSFFISGLTHSALHIACEADEKEIVEYLISKGANTELRNDVWRIKLNGVIM